MVQRVGNIMGWRAYKQPVNFHLSLSEISEVCYASDTLKVVISKAKGRVTRGRGKTQDNVMASFLRERTKRRFLEFMENKGVKINKTAT